MSTPRFLDLPPGVRRVDIDVPTAQRGSIAALEALPGRGCERQPALLVPGFTGSKEDFIAILQTLSDAGRRILAIDLPGQYESTGPDQAEAYLCAALGRVVAEIVHGMDAGPVHLLGHSFGGLVTRETVIAGDAPLASHTLMCSGPYGVGGARALDAERLIALLGPVPTAQRLGELWRDHLDARTVASGVAPHIHGFLRKRMLANSPVGLASMAREVTCATDRTAELAEVDLPTLVLYGENDDAWPPETQATMAKRLRARRFVVPDAAHSPAVEAPETTASALTGFWNEAERLRRR